MKTRIWSLFLTLSLLFGSQIIRTDDTGEQVTIKGYFIKRADSTYLHIEMVGIRMIFKLRDESHQGIENVFTRGVMS